MPATRIIDDHLELANIGTNTHTQIDNHIAAADNYVKRDGSLSLAADWDIGEGRMIIAEKILGRPELDLFGSNGQGITVNAAGLVEIHNTITSGNVFSCKAPSNVIAQFETTKTDGNAQAFIIYAFTPNTGANRGLYVSAINTGAGDAYGYFGVNGMFYNREKVGIGVYPPVHQLHIEGTNSTIQMGDDANNTGRIQWSSVDDILKIFTKVGGTNYGNTIVLDSGKVGIYTTTPTALLDVNSDIIRLRTAKTPATAGAAGNQGDICWDTNYIYVCTATNSWERAAIAAW